MKLGVQGYMTKPYTLLKLHAELTKHLPGRVPPLGMYMVVCKADEIGCDLRSIQNVQNDNIG
jgi:hypothetical protein